MFDELLKRISGKVLEYAVNVKDFALEVEEDEARMIFKATYPGGESIVLLDKTIEGLVGTEWEIIDIPQAFVNHRETYWPRVRELIDQIKYRKLGWCRICKREFIMLPGVPEAEAQISANRLIKLCNLVAIDCLCPNCSTDLTDSDYEGLTYI